MSYFVICLVALVVSTLTLFSGFGLGTLLMPAFAIFFDVELAIAATAVVHLANNLFKASLIGSRADFNIVARFAVPAFLGAAVGAWLLGEIAGLPTLYRYHLGAREFELTVIKLVVAVLIAAFAILEITPRFKDGAFERKYVPLGGLLSGFFGGLSGHQGALRSAFLIRAGLEKEAFIGSVVACAVVVDISRLTVYGATFFPRHFSTLAAEGGMGLLLAGSLAAFAGSFIGVRLLKKVTMRNVRNIVAAMLWLLAIALGTGWI
ncbi:MAG: TSUP family transporter [Nitrospinota bacterium]